MLMDTSFIFSLDPPKKMLRMHQNKLLFFLAHNALTLLLSLKGHIIKDICHRKAPSVLDNAVNLGNDTTAGGWSSLPSFSNWSFAKWKSAPSWQRQHGTGVVENFKVSYKPVCCIVEAIPAAQSCSCFFTSFPGLPCMWCSHHKSSDPGLWMQVSEARSWLCGYVQNVFFSWPYY